MEEAAPRDHFEELLKIFDSPNKSKSAQKTTEEIDKDIERTFPSNIIVATPEGIIASIYYSHNKNYIISNMIGNAKLRKVLGAYSVRNPAIGYCQSMNFLAGVLILHLSEERAFWVLTCLIENILPAEYYTKSMIGCRCDQEVCCHT